MRKIKNKKVKKLLSIFLLGVQALTLILVLLYLAVGSEHVRDVLSAEGGNVSYVLVNEDLGAVFNGVEYNLGSDFVTLISQDDQTRWQTASRSVAEAGFRSGTFDVMIILPQNFSDRLLSLQSFTPEQAQITYEVRMGYNEIANMAIREQVSEILDDFNQRIIRMYFSSILGNLFDAQLNVGAMIDDEQGRHSIFLEAIRTPFYELPSFFEAVVSDTMSIEAETDFWQTQRDEFSESTQQILTSAAEGLGEQLLSLEDYIDLLQLLGEMNQRNAQFSVNNQAEQDEEFYREQFSGFGNTVSTWMSQFYNEDSARGTVLGEFNQTADNFYTDQARLIESLRDEIESLETQIDDLLAARRLVADIYFADENLSLANVTSADTRQAILNLIRIGDYDDELANAYLQTLANDIGQIALDDLEEMIEHLYGLDRLTSPQRNQYIDQIELIRRFIRYEEDITSDANVTFTFVDATNAEHPEYQEFPHIATFEIFPDQAVNVIRLFSEQDNIQIHEDYFEDVIDQLRTQIDAHLIAAGYGIEISDINECAGFQECEDGQHLVIRFREVIETHVVTASQVLALTSGLGIEEAEVVIASQVLALVPDEEDEEINLEAGEVDLETEEPDLEAEEVHSGAYEEELEILEEEADDEDEEEEVEIAALTSNLGIGIEITEVDDEDIVTIDLDNFDDFDFDIDVVHGNIVITIDNSSGTLDLADITIDDVPDDWEYWHHWVVSVDDDIIIIISPPRGYEIVDDDDALKLTTVCTDDCPECPEIEPAPFTVTITMNLIWHDLNEELQFDQQEFGWVSCIDDGDDLSNVLPCERDGDENVIFLSQLAYFVAIYDSHSALLDDIGILLQQFNHLNSASRQIVTLFGRPNTTSQTVGGFLTEIGDSGSIRDLADDDSIYHRYGDLSTNEQQNLIIDSVFYYFQRDGRRLYGNLADRYEQLVVSTIANHLILTSMIDPDSLLSEASRMLTWYLEAVLGVTEGYQSWSQSEILEIMLSHHSGSLDLDSNSATIFVDDRYGGNVLATIGLIMSLMEGDSDSILRHALEMVDLDDQFAQIVSQTEDVQSLAEGILADMGLLSERTDESVLDNLSFSERFSRVMANARIGGADNQDVLGFLASPVYLVGHYERPGEVSFVPYYLTIISVILGFAVGYGLRYFWKQRERTTVDEMVKRSLVWKNTPFVLKLSIVSLSIGLIFSAVGIRRVELASTMMWLMYVPILIAIIILVMSYLARQFPKASLFIVGAIIAAYLLLNPVLGIQVDPDTFVAWLFNMSPLQHIEHLYAMIIAGEFLSALSYVALIGVLAIAVTVNLFVREVKTNDVSKDAGGELINETV